MLHVPVLVLNRLYHPVHVIHARRAFCMLYIGTAKALDDDYSLLDFVQWASLKHQQGEDVVVTSSAVLKVPRVIVLQIYERVPEFRLRLSRQHIFMRDDFTCQYCQRRFARKALNLDHVIPRSQGGRNSWENMVTSCFACNLKKGGRTPEQARMALLQLPRKPQWKECIDFAQTEVLHQQWQVFLGPTACSPKRTS